MACAAFMQAVGLPATASLEEVQAQVYEQGMACVNANLPSCSNTCKDLTSMTTACYNCLASPTLCPDQQCLTNQVQTCTSACCPMAQLAINCGTCLAANGQATNADGALAACMASSGLSTAIIIVIVVCCVVGAIVIITVVVVVVKLKKSAASRERLVSSLKKDGVDPRIAGQIGQLDYSRVNPQIFNEVGTRIALRTASARVASVPPPSRVSVEHLADPTDGFIAL